MDNLDFIGQWFNFRTTILHVVTESVKEAIELMQWEGRKGGYFGLLDHATNWFLIPPILIGEVINGKGNLYAEFCAEKANRTSILIDADVSPAISSRLWLSWESSNPDKQRWPGGVGAGLAGRRLIFSFSGLPPIGDEAAMLLTLAKMGVRKEFILPAADMSDNTIIKEHLRFLEGGGATILPLAA